MDQARAVQAVVGAEINGYVPTVLRRGLRTLPMRVQRHNDTAVQVATSLDQHPRVAIVHYPGLPAHPQHALARAQMTGFGGVLSFEVDGGIAAAEAVVAGLRLAHRSASFGSFSTLVVHPSAMWAGMLNAEQLREADLPPGLVRLGVGFESAAAHIGSRSGAGDLISGV